MKLEGAWWSRINALHISTLAVWLSLIAASRAFAGSEDELYKSISEGLEVAEELIKWISGGVLGFGAWKSADADDSSAMIGAIKWVIAVLMVMAFIQTLFEYMAGVSGEPSLTDVMRPIMENLQLLFLYGAILNGGWQFVQWNYKGKDLVPAFRTALLGVVGALVAYSLADFILDY